MTGAELGFLVVGLFVGVAATVGTILFLANRTLSADDRAIDAVRIDALIYGTGILVRTADGLHRIDPVSVRLVDAEAFDRDQLGEIQRIIDEAQR